MFLNKRNPYISRKEKTWTFSICYSIFVFLVVLTINIHCIYILDITIRLLYSNCEVAKQIMDIIIDICLYLEPIFENFLQFFQYTEEITSHPILDKIFIFNKIFSLLFDLIFFIMGELVLKITTLFNLFFFWYFCIYVPSFPVEAFLFSADSEFVYEMAKLGVSLTELNEYAKIFYFYSSPFAWFKLYPAKIISVIFLTLLLTFVDRIYNE